MKPKDLRLPALLLLPLYVVYACVLVPLRRYMTTDAVLANSPLFDLLDLTLQWSEVIGLILLCAFAIAAVWKFGVRAAKPLWFFAGGMLIFKYLASVLAVTLVIGSLDLTDSYAGYVVSFLLEALILTFTAFLAHLLLGAAKEEIARRENAAKRLGETAPERPDLFRFRPLLSRTNPFQRTAFFTVLAILLLRAVSFLLDDLAYSMAGVRYTAADIPFTLLYLFLEVILPSAVGYLLSLPVIRRAAK